MDNQSKLVTVPNAGASRNTLPWLCGRCRQGFPTVKEAQACCGAQ